MDFSDPKYVLLMKLWTMDANLDENTRFMEHALLLLPVFESKRHEKIISLKIVVQHLISLAIQDADTVRVHRRVLHFIMGNVDHFETATDRMLMWTWILGVLKGRHGAEFHYERVANYCRNRVAEFYEMHHLWRESRDVKMVMTFLNTETCESDVITYFDVCVDVAFYSLLLSDVDMFKVYIQRAMSFEKPFTDSVQCLNYDYLVAQYMDMTLDFGEAATRFLQLSQCGILVPSQDYMMVLAVVNTVLTTNLKLRYSLLEMFCQVNSWWNLRELKGMIPFLVKVLRGIPISKSDLKIFKPFMRPHQLQKDSNGTSPLIAAMIRHNICACGLITHRIQVRQIAHSLGEHESSVNAILMEMKAQDELDTRPLYSVRPAIFMGRMRFLRSVRMKPWIAKARARLAQTVVRDMYVLA